jgi:hypothetical protein
LARVGIEVPLPNLVHFQLRVHLGCRDGLVPKQLLNGQEVSPALQKVHGLGMPQGVRRQMTFYSG